jgi:hypothetical protein
VGSLLSVKDLVEDNRANGVEPSWIFNSVKDEFEKGDIEDPFTNYIDKL